VENIVAGAIDGMRHQNPRTTIPFASTRAAAQALTVAISRQRACPTWTHSSFGPAPAVAPFAYGCLASWWATLPLADQARVLVDIQGGLLCRPNPPWKDCPMASRDMLWRAGSQNEYSEQSGRIMPGVVSGPCDSIRMRTAYIPMTGQEVIKIVKMLGPGIVPPEFTQLAQAASFIGRSFLIGLQMKQPGQMGPVVLGSLSTPQELLKLVDQMVEDIVLIWAPGQGESIRAMVVSGQANPAQLLVLMQKMLPSAVGDLFKTLPNILPGLLGAITGQQTSGFIDSVQSRQRPTSASPPTPPTTGLPISDEPGDQQDTSNPFGSGQTGIIVAGIVLAAVAIAYRYSR